mmetsp:Transcript_39854/g.105416  ORF Transcript_39854/g.105416 Transcript_39854/m.105416 type:complete len:334 (+) Transcript_39854:96-1097(+)
MGACAANQAAQDAVAAEAMSPPMSIAADDMGAGVSSPTLLGRRQPGLSKSGTFERKRDKLRKLRRHCNSTDFMKLVPCTRKELAKNSTVNDYWAAEADPACVEPIHPSAEFSFSDLDLTDFSASPTDEDTHQAKCIPKPIVAQLIHQTTCSTTCSAEEPEPDDDDEEGDVGVPPGARLDEPMEEGQNPRPDFGGSWLCCRVEGDWDSYLKEAGVSWTLRKTISSMGYGVGRQSQEIAQSQSEISVKNVVSSFPPREALCVYRLDGQPEEVLDFEGQLIRSVTFWDEDVLVTEQRTPDTLQMLPTARRLLLGGEMCSVRTSAGGLEVKRFYARR